MMMHVKLVAAAIIALVIAGSGTAAEKHRPPCRAVPDCPPICWGADDYCRKPVPCVAPLCVPPDCGCYCRKPAPCIALPCQAVCCDDYCRKPAPAVCYPQLPPDCTSRKSGARSVRCAEPIR